MGDLRKRPCGSSWKTRSVFQGAVGALCASTAPSASTGPVRVRQNGSRGGNGELDRRRPRTAVDPLMTNVHIQPPICTDRALELSWKDSNIRYLDHLGNSDIACLLTPAPRWSQDQKQAGNGAKVLTRSEGVCWTLAIWASTHQRPARCAVRTRFRPMTILDPRSPIVADQSIERS